MYYLFSVGWSVLLFFALLVCVCTLLLKEIKDWRPWVKWTLRTVVAVLTLYVVIAIGYKAYFFGKRAVAPPVDIPIPVIEETVDVSTEPTFTPREPTDLGVVTNKIIGRNKPKE